jgi:hypothetical protein
MSGPFHGYSLVSNAARTGRNVPCLPGKHVVLFLAVCAGRKSAAPYSCIYYRLFQANIQLSAADCAAAPSFWGICFTKKPHSAIILLRQINMNYCFGNRLKPPVTPKTAYAPVAQLDRALDSDNCDRAPLKLNMRL